MKTWVGIIALLGWPCGYSAAQELDSVRAHELVDQIARDVRGLDGLSDLRFLTGPLSSIETFFGVEFELPPGREAEIGGTRAHLEVIYAELGAEELLDAAARLDDERGRSWWKPLALEMIARRAGPVAALEAATDRGLLTSAFHSLLNGAGLRRLEEVLTWITEADLDPDDLQRLRVQALGFGSVYEPDRFWRRADSLPEPSRTRVRVRALESTASVELPDSLLEAELGSVWEVGASLEGSEARDVVRVVVQACGRRPLRICADLPLPMATVDAWAGTDVINLTSAGALEEATNRLNQLRQTEQPLVVARWMAQGLESVGRNCPGQACDLARIDSLATEWMREVLEVEAEVRAGRLERSFTWNGTDDLVELQRALGTYLSARDLDGARALLGRMDAPDAIQSVLTQLIQVAPDTDLIGAVEVYLEFAADGVEPLRIYYSDLIRAGRPDLAGRMLERASPHTAMRARMDWVGRLTRAGRVTEARAELRALMSGSGYDYPSGSPQLLSALQSLRMLEEYLGYVLELPTAVERLNGLVPLVEAWVQMRSWLRGPSVGQGGL